MNSPLASIIEENLPQHLTTAEDSLKNEDILTRVGQLTRDLHQNLSGLGFDKLLQNAAEAIPNARDRLDYVAKMTEQAADKVLNAIDVASPLQDEICSAGKSLEKKWQTVLESTSFKKQYSEAASDTLAFLKITNDNTEKTKQQLLEIMMAQDFQDLTGQVIKKVMALAQDIEKQLLQVLVDFKQPSVVKHDVENSLLNGPQIDPKNAVNVVSDQQQVDDLLDSLGF
ncbi:MAG: protein phosphatase CheZ [Methylophilaceae bacterium]|nr:protein phosphatase CheZ [Methylophilaceae bacterium]